LSGNVVSRKAALRRQLRAALQAMSEAERASGSGLICERLTGDPLWRDARSVLLFMPTRLEPDVKPLLDRALREGRRVALPRHRAVDDTYEACWVERPETDLAPGLYGIREPRKNCAAVAGNALDLILVPGLGFSPDGGRLGRGKGYYDQLLASIPGVTCGVAFDGQVTFEVPVESHDVVLNCILTPTRWLKLTSPGRS
jgi:5-formyltetrahydrofolate cyclo-ligase